MRLDQESVTGLSALQAAGVLGTRLSLTTGRCSQEAGTVVVADAPRIVETPVLRTTLQVDRRKQGTGMGVELSAPHDRSMRDLCSREMLPEPIEG